METTIKFKMVIMVMAKTVRTIKLMPSPIVVDTNYTWWGTEKPELASSCPYQVGLIIEVHFH